MDKTKEKTVREDFETGTDVGQTKPKAASTDSAPEPERGAVFGRYTVLDRLATGPAATVFSAYDAQRERVVALKILRAQLDTPEARARILRDAQVMARLKHPHVVRVYEVGTFGDRLYIAMELVEGSTLRKWMSKPRPWREVLDVLKAAGRGLAAAHEAGLVHRDFNPDKVLVAKDGRVLVTDFGIARPEQPPQSAPTHARPASSAVDSSELETRNRVDAAAKAEAEEEEAGEDDDATVARKIDAKNLLASVDAATQATEAEASAAKPAPTEPADALTKPGPAERDGDEGSRSPVETSDGAAKPESAASSESGDKIATAESNQAPPKSVPAEAKEPEAQAAPATDAPTPKDDAAQPEIAAARTEADGAPTSNEGASDDDDATVALKIDAKKLATESNEAPSDDAKLADDTKLAEDEEEPTVALKLGDMKAAAGTKAPSKESENDKELAADDDDATVALKTDTKKLAAESEAPKVIGVPGFIAPEHLASGQDNPRSDQFSFAATMYVTLYGQQPYRFRDLASYRDAVRRPPQPPPPSPVPAWIHGVIERGLRRDPQQRFSSMTDLLDSLERDPSRRRRLWGLGATAAAVGVAALLGYAQHRADVERQCAEGSAIIAATWNPAIEGQTNDALVKLGGQHGAKTAKLVTSRLSAYAQSWAASHRQIAEATLMRGEQDAAMMDRRLRCLERGREQLAALTAILSRADDTVGQHAVEAAFALPAPGPCAKSDVSAIPALPAPSDQRARVLAAEHAIAQAIAHDKAGEDRKAQEIIARSLPDVRALPHPRLEAELLLVESDCQQDLGDPRAALDSTDIAFQAAQRAADDGLASRAAARMAYLLSSWLDKPQEAERWMKTAEAIADRAGHNDTLDATLLGSRIPVNAMLGYPEKNLELHDKEVALLERLYSEADPRLARAIANRGITYYLLGKFERALVDMQQGVALMTRVTGSNNPHLVHDYTNLGAVLLALGRTQDARVAYEHARALQADAPPGSLTMTILGALASIELEIGTPDSAIEIAERGLEVAHATGEKGMLEWALRLAIAKAKGKKGDFAGEADGCRAVLTLQKAADAFKRDAPYTPDALTCLGLAELGQHHVDAALAHLEESVTFQLRTEPGDLPTARFALAKALRIAGRDTARAREMALSARNDLLKLPNLGKELADVESWLEELNGPAPAQ